MPVISINALIWVLCVVHIIRTGRPFYWFMVISVPLIGPLVYFAVELLPEMSRDPGVHRATQKVLRKIDPERERKRIEHQLQIADTPKNRLALAQESLRMGDYVNASDLFQSCLTGIYAHDPLIMLGFAQARFGMGDFANARQLLEELIAKNPNFKSQQGHLLYARVLEGLKDTAAARAEYEAVVKGYAGEEARARFALFLKDQGRPDEARQLFEQMLARARLAPRHYRREQKQWLNLAHAELQALRQSQQQAA